MTDATDDLEDQEFYRNSPISYDLHGQAWSNFDRIRHEKLNKESLPKKVDNILDKIKIKQDTKIMTKEIALLNFNEEQIKLIKSQIAPKATDSELQLFLYQAKRTGLDPLTRQIYAIHRACKENVNGAWVWVNKMSIQTSIDGFRVIAERSGDYAGQDEPIFTEEGAKLISCKVTVYRFRGDVRYPAAVGVAYWSEYVQTDKDGNASGLWKKMPHTMLSKVAEALALRKAYPQDLSGLYTSDEMNQADDVKVVEPKVCSDDKGFFKQSLSNNIADDQEMQQLKALKKEEKAAANAQTFFAKLKEDIEGCGSLAEVQGLEEANKDKITRLKESYPNLHTMLSEAIDAVKLEFMGE